MHEGFAWLPLDTAKIIPYFPSCSSSWPVKSRPLANDQCYLLNAHEYKHESKLSFLSPCLSKPLPSRFLNTAISSSEERLPSPLTSKMWYTIFTYMAAQISRDSWPFEAKITCSVRMASAPCILCYGNAAMLSSLCTLAWLLESS